jgi:hypothetical protein
MELSRKMVNKHWLEVFVFLLLASLLWHVGYVACCVGVFLTAPLALAAKLYAYEDIFSPALPALSAAGGPLPPPPAAGDGPAKAAASASADQPSSASGPAAAPAPIGPGGTLVLPAGSVNPPPGGAAAGVRPPGPIGPGQSPPAGGGNNRALLYLLLAVIGVIGLVVVGLFLVALAPFLLGMGALALLASVIPQIKVTGSNGPSFPSEFEMSHPHLLGLGAWEIVLIIGAMLLVLGLGAVILFILTRKSKPATATPGRLPASTPGAVAGRAGPPVKPASGGGGASRFLHFALLLVGGGCLILVGICLLTSAWEVFPIHDRRPFHVLTVIGLILATTVAITAVILGGRGVFRSRTAPAGGVLKSSFKILLLLLTGLLALLLGVLLVISYVTHNRVQAPWNITYEYHTSTAAPTMPTMPPMPPMPTMPSMPTMPTIPPVPTMPVPTPAQPVPSAEVNTNDFYTLLTRTRQELGKLSVRFNQMHLTSQNDKQVIVMLSGLQQLEIVNGQNTWADMPGMAGSLQGNRFGQNRWKFDGQGQLAAVHFDLDPWNLNPALAASLWLANQPAGDNKNSPADLAARLEAAESINQSSVRDQAMAALAKDAATVGDFPTTQSALAQINAYDQRDAATHDAALLLAKAGFRKQAVQLAQGINAYTVRDRTLSELAQ